MKRRLAFLIPIVLDLGVLFIAPLTFDEFGIARGLALCVVAFVAPWVPFTIISLVIDREISKEKHDWEEKQQRDFV